MTCIPFCMSCGRNIDCDAGGYCPICYAKIIEKNKNPTPSKSTGLNVVHETDFMNKAVK